MKSSKTKSQLKNSTKRFAMLLIAGIAASFFVSCGTRNADKSPFSGGFSGEDFVFTDTNDVLITENGTKTNKLSKAVGAWGTIDMWWDK